MARYGNDPSAGDRLKTFESGLQKVYAAGGAKGVAMLGDNINELLQRKYGKSAYFSMDKPATDPTGRTFVGFDQQIPGMQGNRPVRQKASGSVDVANGAGQP